MPQITATCVTMIRRGDRVTLPGIEKVDALCVDWVTSDASGEITVTDIRGDKYVALAPQDITIHRPPRKSTRSWRRFMART